LVLNLKQKSQEALHGAALKQFNAFYEYRRARLHSVTSSIPAVMWYTVAVGALLNILLLLLFDLRLGIHLLLGGILVFSGDLNLADRVDGSPFSRRNERVTHSIPTCLRSGYETVTSVGGEDRYGRSRLTRLNAPFSAVFCDQATIEFTRYAWIVPPTEWIW
jgi:hypothetical protein